MERTKEILGLCKQLALRASSRIQAQRLSGKEMSGVASLDPSPARTTPHPRKSLHHTTFTPCNLNTLRPCQHLLWITLVCLRPLDGFRHHSVVHTTVVSLSLQLCFHPVAERNAAMNMEVYSGCFSRCLVKCLADLRWLTLLLRHSKCSVMYAGR